MAAPAAGARVVDVGSGAGIPGIPVAVVRPDLEVVLCNSDHKRAAFLEHIATLLGLERVSVAAVRAEELGRTPGAREGFDLALSRATAPPPVLCELCLPLLRRGGRLAALVRDAPAAAPLCAAAAAACGGGRPEAPSADVLIVPKVAPTPTPTPAAPGSPHAGRSAAKFRPSARGTRCARTRPPRRRPPRGGPRRARHGARPGAR